MATTFIAGGTEAPLTDFTIAQMKALRIYSQETGEYKCRALDLEKKVNTMILGEAAACFLLCKKPSANGIKISGYGTAIENLESATSMSADGLGFQQSMLAAIGDLPLDSIDAIVTHAPGTIKGDASEMTAIEHAFAKAKTQPALFNNKWQIGHSLGASAAVNLYMAMDLLQNKTYPRIPYLEAGNRLISNNQSSIKRVLINASGFGGNCVTLLLEKD